MKAFVTGATGKIGRLVSIQLIDGGWSVDAVVLPGEDADSLSHKGVALFRGDVTVRSSIDRAIEQSNPDIIFHLAGYVKLGMLGDSKSKQRRYDVNVNGTRNVLQAALDHGIKKTVYLSTVAIFDSSGRNDYRINEQTPLLAGNTMGDYGKTKLLAYQEAMNIQDRGLALLVFIPGIIFGQGIPGTISLLNAFYHGTMRRLPSNYAENSLPLVFASDFLKALSVGIERNKFGERYLLAESIPIPQILEVCSAVTGKKIHIKSISYGKAVVFAWLAETISRLRGSTPVITVHKVINSFQIYAHRFDTSKAERELDWKPTALREACRQTFAWFLENRATVNNSVD